MSQSTESSNGGEARQEANASEGQRRPALGRYLLSALVLIALIAAVFGVHSWLHSRIRRPPVEFLPSSTRAAVAIDLRPESAAMRAIREAWRADDIQHLASRATALSQDLVDWTGLKLDLRKEAAPWFGGELVAAAIGEAAGPPGPRSLVLIVRVTSLRQARASLERAIAPMARELDWRRSARWRAGGRITIWRAPSGREEVAYAAQDGCLLVAVSPESIAACLQAGQERGQRLTATEGFRVAMSRLPAEATIWCYLDVAHAGQAARYLLPGLRQGWLGLLRAYLQSSAGRHGEESPEEASSVLAVALAPAADGVRLKAVYWRPQSPEAGPPPHLEKLASVLPRETAAYLLVHKPSRWLQVAGRVPRLRDRGEPEARDGGGPLVRLAPWLSLAALPKHLLVALLPRPGDARPALLVAAPANEMVLPGEGLPGWVLPHLVAATVGDLSVIASDERALAQCREAAANASYRLLPPRGGDCEFELWARPGDLSQALARFRELQIRGWEASGGGAGELWLKAEPRRLLGGG